MKAGSPAAAGGNTLASTPEACLQQTLLRFQDDPWKVADAVEGTQVFGGTGSGKTTGSGRAIARRFIQAGFGGLVLTAKPDDLLQWVRYLRAAGLSDRQIRERLVVVEPPGTPHPAAVRPRATEDGEPTSRETERPLELPVCQGFNFLQYEHEAGNGLTHDIVSLFLNTMSAGGGVVSRADPYWDEALRELLTHAVDLALCGTDPGTGRPALQLDDLVALIRTAPQSRSEAASPTWRNATTSRCWQLISLATRAAKDGRLPSGRLHDLAQTVDYWLNDFPSLSDRTRSVVVSSFTAKAAGLLRYPLRELLCGTTSTAVSALPEVTHRGKIVILNLPVKLYGEVGRFAQTIWKTVWQRATERRVGQLAAEWPAQRPVFLWADEAQYFLTREDALFQQTARSALAATVFLSQNISNYYSALGGDSGKAATDSLLGNLQTKIFHANGDPATNEWAERLFAKHWVELESQGASTGLALAGAAGASTQAGQSSQRSWQHVPVVEARAFLTMATGGPRYERAVEAVIAKAGRRWYLRDAEGRTVRDPQGHAVDLDHNQQPVSVLHHVFRQDD